MRGLHEPDGTLHLVSGPQAEPMRPDPALWSAAHEELVATLRDLVRIPSVNPPQPEAPDAERRVAEYLAAALA
ncbi:MAG: hypothetical protein C4343_06350, partial [Chloroflexota bacterium]